MNYKSTFSDKLIYIFRINGSPQHSGCVKIGETTSPDGDFLPNSRELNQAAKERIRQYTQTAGIQFELLHTEQTKYKGNDGVWYGFNDKKVHNILLRSGIKKKLFRLDDGKANEWFECDLQTAIKAIEAAKNGQDCLYPNQISVGRNPVEFRPEQLRAIEQTKRVLKHSDKMLWNAKMRMGKTLTSLEVVKQLKFKRTIIVTHRPVVDAGWFEDFGKIFFEDDSNYVYGSKNKGLPSISSLEHTGKSYVYFASMQDLRGSKMVGGDFDKNEDVFDTHWDFVIVDEAHEGTQTELGQRVLDELIEDKTKLLSLSGTPFNLLDNFDEENVFTWDYVMEQQAKVQWNDSHPGDPNPYEELPRLNILTFNLGELTTQYIDEDKAFNFSEFFRTDYSTGEFIHNEAVKRFLDIISSESSETLYPYSRQAYREFFKHTLWVVPGVKEGKALTEMLRNHYFFGQYDVVNVAGQEDDEAESDNALQEVLGKIGDYPENTRTITISCGKLTTGVTVRPWTAVMYMAGSKSTSAQTYMQTIFRVQSPAVIAGRQKRECYVFDFAPDRTLKVIAEVAKISAKAGATSESDRTVLGNFLNFCPIISCVGTSMHHYSVEQMMQQLKRVYVDKVVQSGFEDGHLYSDKLFSLTDVEIEKFNDLNKIIGLTKANKRSNDISVNSQGFDREDIEKEIKNAKQKESRVLTEEEALEQLRQKEKKQQRDTAVSILRGISIRMPLLLYGAKLKNEDENINLDKFVALVDNTSWEEFMPQGVTKERFNDYKEYYDEDIFAAAGRQIRALAYAADKMPVLQRIQRITDIFNSFRNPDKETVLTPWRVVNMHLSDTIGGYNFYDSSFTDTVAAPVMVDKGLVTQRIFENPDVKILEINSKSGLYPLYMAYSVYRYRLRQAEMSKAQSALFDKALSQEEEYDVWYKVLSENLFVICKTEMARSITCRTLVGFTNAKTNTHVYDDLLNQITNKSTEFITRLSSGSVFKQIRNMKFDVIVGNPPYQVMGGSGGNNDAPIYQHFSQIATRLQPKYISLIIKAAWFAAGRENLLADFRREMLNCGRIKELTVYPDASQLFRAEIKGGICYYLEDRDYSGNCKYTIMKPAGPETVERDLSKFDILIREPKLASIVEKVEAKRKADNMLTVDTIMSADTPFGIPSNPKESSKTPFKVYETSAPGHDTLLYHIENSKRRIEYVSARDVSKNFADISKHKVFVPGGYGAGESFPHQILGVPEYAPVNSVCSQSYLYAPFATRQEALAFIKYLKTKFFRALVCAIKITQSAPNRVYKFVPLQDFTDSSNINWEASVEDINLRLYQLYNLSSDEIDFIEAAIKPM